MVFSTAFPVKDIIEVIIKINCIKQMKSLNITVWNTNYYSWFFRQSRSEVTFSLTGRKKLLSGVAGLGLLYDIPAILAGLINS